MDNMEISLEAKIEGILFYKNEDMSFAELAKIFNVEKSAVLEAVLNLEKSLENRGVVLIKKDESIALGINNQLSAIIEDMRKNEVNKELSKASLDTLSVILYKGEVSRNELDYIRGVNSGFILRNLLIRGLIEKTNDKNDSRRTLYRPTFNTLSYMGITSIEELPNYEEVKTQLQNITENNQEDNA